MIISVLSGKGGTGKTTVATSLFLAAGEATYIDCDVEEPNGHLFLKPEFTNRISVEVMIPEVDQNLCSGCGRCAQACQFNAIVSLKGQVLVFPQLCHSCGACIIACPKEAIREGKRPVGLIEEGDVASKKFLHGVLNIGEPMPVPVINQLKDKSRAYSDEIVVIDCPPGSSCSVISAIEGSDFCLLVTEPSPFGLHDLKIAVKLVKYLGLPLGIVVNKADQGNSLIWNYSKEAKVPILQELPYDRRIAEVYSEGGNINSHVSEWRTSIERLIALVKEAAS